MGYLYVTESSAKVSFEENSFYVKKKDNSTTRIPAETLESISFFGNPQMTTQCMQQCMKRGISVSFYSKGGQYFGRLLSTGHANVERQRKQCESSSNSLVCPPSPPNSVSCLQHRLLLNLVRK